MTRRSMARVAPLGALLVALAFAVGCGGGARAVPRMADVDRARQSPAAREAAQLAPQAYAHAEEERTLAAKAQEAKDDLAAQLHADRALAAYEHAFVLARLARATRELDAANAALAAVHEQARQIAASREDAQREAADLVKTQMVAAIDRTPEASKPADPKREAARLVAARALATEARLLCGAARLVSADPSGLGDAQKDVAALDAQLAGAPRPAPIDAAVRVRARCLDLLTRARRGGGGGAGAKEDALLSDLSASGGFDPSRDERGVVVTLRDYAKGAALTPDADAKLRELGRVVASHAGVAAQVVVHDAAAPSKSDEATDAQRAAAAAKALVAGGAPEAKVQAETAGDRAPIVDPADAAHRARNARLEVVLIAPRE